MIKFITENETAFADKPRKVQRVGCKPHTTCDGSLCTQETGNSIFKDLMNCMTSCLLPTATNGEARIFHAFDGGVGAGTFILRIAEVIVTAHVDTLKFDVLTN